MQLGHQGPVMQVSRLRQLTPQPGQYITIHAAAVRKHGREEVMGKEWILNS